MRNYKNQSLYNSLDKAKERDIELRKINRFKKLQENIQGTWHKVDGYMPETKIFVRKGQSKDLIINRFKERNNKCAIICTT